jgi:hypothetical protein
VVAVDTAVVEIAAVVVETAADTIVTVVETAVAVITDINLKTSFIQKGAALQHLFYC